MRKYRGSRQVTENWNADLRKEVQALKERLRVDTEFEKFLKKNDLECVVQFDRTVWEVKIHREWMNDCWSVVKYHEDKFSAMNMALVEARQKVGCVPTGQLYLKF